MQGKQDTTVPLGFIYTIHGQEPYYFPSVLLNMEDKNRNSRTHSKNPPSGSSNVQSQTDLEQDFISGFDGGWLAETFILVIIPKHGRGRRRRGWGRRRGRGRAVTENRRGRASVSDLFPFLSCFLLLTFLASNTKTTIGAKLGLKTSITSYLSTCCVWCVWVLGVYSSRTVRYRTLSLVTQIITVKIHKFRKTEILFYLEISCSM